LGFFLTPMSSAHGWGRDVFALALAVQMLLWGAAQPVAGALADRYGATPILSVGAVLYALGLASMAYANTPAMLHLTAGAVIGFGLAGSSFTIVIGAFGKLMPPQWRSLAFGAGTAAGSFGQFVFSPLAVALIDNIGWQDTLVAFAAVVLLIMPLSLALASPRQAGGPTALTNQAQQSVAQALSEALGHKSFVLLVLGFFTCGFQIFFIAVHLPAYLVDRGLPAEVGGWTLASIGLFNIIGAVVAGWLAAFMPKRYILSLIYFGRAVAILIYILLPPSTVATLIFGAAMGLFWLSTVPPTSGLVAVMFGTRWLAMLFGFAFFSHQVGGFLGVWLGGVLFESSGSYDVVWWLSILLGLLSAVINLPIVERPVARLAPA
jgi:MFS family permease